MTLINHAPWCSQCQNMIPINQISSPLHRWGVIPVCNRNQVERRGGIGEASSSVGRGVAVMSHPFLGEGDPLRTQGEGDVPVCNRHQGEEEPRGGGTVMSHPFQGGGGGPWWVIRRGDKRGGVAPPTTTKGRGMTVPTLNQPYTNIASIKSVKPPICRWSYTWMYWQLGT